MVCIKQGQNYYVSAIWLSWWVGLVLKITIIYESTKEVKRVLEFFLFNTRKMEFKSPGRDIAAHFYHWNLI